MKPLKATMPQSIGGHFFLLLAFLRPPVTETTVYKAGALFGPATLGMETTVNRTLTHLLKRMEKNCS